MKFTFGEVVKLASKGFKPGDINELSELDENKFSKEDILSLIGNGYSKADIKKLVETFSASEDSEEDHGDDTEEQNDHLEKPETKPAQNDSVKGTSKDKEDIDYKTLYEKEKKLREEIQHSNAKKGSVIPEDTRSAEQIAIEIAEMF